MNIVNKIAYLALVVAVAGCAASRSQESSSVSSSCPGCAPQPPGVTQYVWEEPMVDVVEVPPGLDPEGIYYRPAHQEVVEIRQGRWKYHKPAE